MTHIFIDFGEILNMLLDEAFQESNLFNEHPPLFNNLVQVLQKKTESLLRQNKCNSLDEADQQTHHME